MKISTEEFEKLVRQKAEELAKSYIKSKYELEDFDIEESQQEIEEESQQEIEEESQEEIEEESQEEIEEESQEEIDYNNDIILLTNEMTDKINSIKNEFELLKKEVSDYRKIALTQVSISDKSFLTEEEKQKIIK